MSLLIRIPFTVENMHALSGYFTDGPSMMAFNGLVAQLEDDAQFEVSRFGLVVESYEARHAEVLTTSLDATTKLKQKDGFRAGTGYRYANMRAALYIETQELSSEDLTDLLQCIEVSLNSKRLQGGNLFDYIAADAAAPVHLSIEQVSSPADWAAFVSKHEKPLSTLYLTSHLKEAYEGDALIEAYAQALMHKHMLLVCNGYVQVGSMVDRAGQTQNIGEPSFTLVETLQVYQLRKMTADQTAEAFPRFFWSFDHALNDKNPNHFILT